MILRHWELKLLSLVAAFALWLFVAAEEKGEVVLSARVEYVHVPGDLLLTAAAPAAVDLQVRGWRSALARLGPDDLRPEVDLAKFGAGDAVAQLLPGDVRAPRDVTVLRVSPSRLHLTLEPVATAEVRVVPRLVGSPEPGFALRGVSVTPAVVEVRGSRSEVLGRSELPTVPVDLSAARGPVRRRVELAPLSGGLRVSGTRTVEVTVDIREEHGVPQRRSAP